MPVYTVTGPIAAEQLGTCLMHVHLLGGPDETPGEPDLHLPDADAAARELTELAAAGAGAVLEMSCWDFARSLERLAAVSRRSGVAIVAVAGFRSGATAGAQAADQTVEAIVERICEDLAPAADGTPTSGAIKGGSGRGALSAQDEKVLRAAARAQVRSGAPLLTHTEHGELALDQLRIFDREGVDPARTAIGHLDRAGVERQLEVLATGANIVLDQIGKLKYLSLDDYRRILERLLEEGHEERVMLSSDFGRRSYLHAYGGEPGLDYLLRSWMPALIARGIPATAMQRMLIDNPARFLSYDRDSQGRGADVRGDVDVHA
jgi:predicted metal-dependent phosphotriesterase family hydrolase